MCCRRCFGTASVAARFLCCCFLFAGYSNEWRLLIEFSLVLSISPSCSSLCPVYISYKNTQTHIHTNTFIATISISFHVFCLWQSCTYIYHLPFIQSFLVSLLFFCSAFVLCASLPDLQSPTFLCLQCEKDERGQNEKKGKEKELHKNRRRSGFSYTALHSDTHTHTATHPYTIALIEYNMLTVTLCALGINCYIHRYTPLFRMGLSKKAKQRNKKKVERKKDDKTKTREKRRKKQAMLHINVLVVRFGILHMKERNARLFWCRCYCCCFCVFCVLVEILFSCNGLGVSCALV